MTEQTTPWFSWPTVPVRAGWYDFRGAGVCAGMRLYWNGHEFGYWMHASKKAFSWVAMADDESDQWRGLVRAAAEIGKEAS